MKMTTLLNDGTMPVDMEIPAPEAIQISLTIRDELDFPLERRGYRTRLPRNDDDKAAVAKSIGETAEKTARFMMGLSIDEEGN